MRLFRGTAGGLLLLLLSFTFVEDMADTAEADRRTAVILADDVVEAELRLLEWRRNGCC